MIPSRMCHKTKGAAKRGGFQLGTKNILWNTTISNRATHGWADWNISGNKHYGATQIHTETINLNGEEGGSKFDPERNQSRASNKGIRPPIQASQDYQEGRDRYSPGRTDLQARSSERGAAAVCGGSGGEEEDYSGAEPGERRVRRRRVRCPPPPPARTKTSRGREPAGEAGKRCQRAELERVAEPLGKPVLNLT